MNLFEKIVAISAAVEKLRKDGNNSHHKYKFFSHSIVTESVRDLLIEHKIVTHVTMHDGSCRVELIDADDPAGLRLSGVFDVPRPNDQPQSTGAIISYAVKFFYMKTFMLQDVETPDIESMQPRAKQTEAPAVDFDKMLQLLKDASSKEELGKVVEGLDQNKYSKTQWNQLSAQYKETLNAVANANG
jgi:hypothetical protein